MDLSMSPAEGFSGTVLLVTRQGMGSAQADLQRKLFGTYLKLLLQAEDLPSAICFYTEGVKLVAEGSPVLEELHQLAARGVRLIICSTCLEYFKLKDKVMVGIVGGMGDILEAQMKAEKVISL
jgi:intracellular sulfur oxidation DsrE/DsrF family protein